MESFVNRYRNLTILLLVIFAQFLLLALQVKNDQDVRIIRVWTVTAVTPFARVVELLRGGSVGFFRNYVLLRDEDAENRRLRDQVGHLKLENVFLKNELNTAERAKALGVFQARIPSKTLAATVIGAGAGSNANPSRLRDKVAVASRARPARVAVMRSNTLIPTKLGKSLQVRGRAR